MPRTMNTPLSQPFLSPSIVLGLAALLNLDMPW